VTFEEWTVTILGSVPPVIKESARISAKYVLIGEESQKDMYRLDAGWQIQFELVKVAEKHRVTYSVKEGEGNPVDAEDAYALYEEKAVETLTDGERRYIFVGWYFDETLINAVTYPFVLSSDITLYAKCIDNTTGSNGEDYQVSGEADDKIIELYLGESDNKIVIISTMSSNPIKRIESGWIYDEINGTHTRNGDEYILDSVNGKYRRVGAFEGHNELNEVYFALGSQITTIGKDALRGVKILQKSFSPRV
ncbi:MAG: InlB B-repeat-containing protein, partial [Christensenellales bacterium]